ncbi:hypothetical protein DUI87_09168 [Hirundo rustica rustica]|uniref:Uncharacterized protein n=1 Tax=Hirundo rustica rustica TaxID=333673 RepID=A0A3M0KTJ8_HIRRU|nr:hypothetical protein DUI87_09168 [Hirundo rustica rustica]
MNSLLNKIPDVKNVRNDFYRKSHGKRKKEEELPNELSLTHAGNHSSYLYIFPLLADGPQGSQYPELEDHGYKNDQIPDPELVQDLLLQLDP